MNSRALTTLLGAAAVGVFTVLVTAGQTSKMETDLLVTFHIIAYSLLIISARYQP